MRKPPAAGRMTPKTLGCAQADEVYIIDRAAHLADQRRPGQARTAARRRTTPCCPSARAARQSARAGTSRRLSTADWPYSASGRPPRGAASNGRRPLDAARLPRGARTTTAPSWAGPHARTRAPSSRSQGTARPRARDTHSRSPGLPTCPPRAAPEHRVGAGLGRARLRPWEARRHRGRGVRQYSLARARLAAAARRRWRARRHCGRAGAAARCTQPGEHVARRAQAGATVLPARQRRAPRGRRCCRAGNRVGRRRVPAWLRLQRREGRGARGVSAVRRRDRGARGGAAGRPRHQKGRRRRAGGGRRGRSAGAAQRRDEGRREQQRRRLRASACHSTRCVLTGLAVWSAPCMLRA